MSSSDTNTSPMPDQSNLASHTDEDETAQVKYGAGNEGKEDGETDPSASNDPPPLPSETPPPLPDTASPNQQKDDGWEPVWDTNAQAYYFFNRINQITQWENPRLLNSTTSRPQPPPPGVEKYDTVINVDNSTPVSKPSVNGYDPAIHGDYDPNADYAKVHESANGGQDRGLPSGDPSAAYSATGAFNRFTGKWQNADFTPDRFNDENKSRRQMNAFFDVDAAANTHEGKSLKAERANKKLSKKELRAFKDKRREKKEEKRRAWLRD